MPAKNKKKSKQQKKSQQQRKKDKHKQKAQKRQEQRRKKNHQQSKHGTAAKHGSEFKHLSHQELLHEFKKGYSDLNVDHIEELQLSTKNLTFKQQALAECFNTIWAQCSQHSASQQQACSEHALSQKLRLLEILIADFKLNVNASTNFFSPRDDDTLFDRIRLLCNKCLLPMMQSVIEHVQMSEAYRHSLKLLVLQQLFCTLYEYQDNLGVKFESNSLGIINMSWTNVIEPTLKQWWDSQRNTCVQCRAVVPWSISQGVLLDVVFPYFSDFEQFVMQQEAVITDIDGADDKERFDPLKWDMSENEMNVELKLPRVVYEALMVTIGKSLLRRRRAAKDESVSNIERVYDQDLEYLYMCVADLFDEGRLRWLRTDEWVKVYQNYVNIVNGCIDAQYPLIGKIVTYFLIGNAGMIIV